jgi:L-iditol 2-dehydrogenase
VSADTQAATSAVGRAEPVGFAGRRPRQAMLTALGRIELREVTPSRPGPGELLVQVKCALSCGTDLKTYRRGHPLWQLPMPLGHEFSGIVAEAGEGACGFAAGDEIMAAPTAPCGECFYCKRGQENLCPLAMERMVLGAYADFVLLPANVVARNTFRKPPGLPFEEAALLEPLSCVIHAQELARPQNFETALILGAGPFGLLHLLVLKAMRVREVAVAGRGESRLRWAGEMGASRVIDVRNEDTAQAAATLNGGYGPDLVIECTGRVEGWRDAFSRVRRGGRVVFFGGCPANTALNVDTRRMHYDNMTLLAPFHFRPRDVRRAFELLRDHRIAAAGLINARRRLDELDEVFSLLERGAALKCAVIP